MCAVAIAGVLVRPFGIAEWVWASAAAAIVAVTGLLPFSAVIRSIAGGSDVYLFLAGMMVLAEVARREGVFDWVASLAVRASHGSRARLFTLVYGVGIVVTAVLSNDATAVVLTPAVAASVRAAKAAPLPYLFACALIANAASFILPISNPANLVVFGHAIPPLARWAAAFALPSFCAIALTYVMLRLFFRRELAGELDSNVETVSLSAGGRIAVAGIACTAIALVIASSAGSNLGLVTAISGAIVYGCAISADRRALRSVAISVSWSVLFLVAGLFVLVAAAESAGLLGITRIAMRAIAEFPAPLAVAAAGFATGLGSNLINNLPAGLIAGTTVAGAPVNDALRSAVAIGIDLGPNLSVTGSLATILWLLALRRDEIEIDAWQFLRVGAVTMPLALLAAVESTLAYAR